MEEIWGLCQKKKKEIRTGNVRRILFFFFSLLCLHVNDAFHFSSYLYKITLGSSYSKYWLKHGKYNSSYNPPICRCGHYIVVHTAGPFQQSENCKVLEAAIGTKTAYLDVCDDTNYATRAKSYMNKALEANIPAITTGGIYPGVSNVMAAELVRTAKLESNGEVERLR
ncbi:PREDICTED: uncharacterized protein LOC109227533 [Nicotiana attenuata]|uniref:Uncharacterized protein n=1 Tax=Nicotiana attenuata TaxID=49451 RepID=A0A1J6JES6_NICAT|nr:PREDICTED: uncharacterized protein LOC109227533 [Nicotiana attenuata]OIT08191.1 hypothetical protein A4A49_06435 [Nicotiana attenuata]